MVEALRRRARAASLALAFACALASPLASQPAAQEETIRVPVWVYYEGVPGAEERAETDTGQAAQPAEPPYEQLRTLSRFLLAGMIYGWKYEYRPSDKLRGVEEEFTLVPIGTIDRSDPSFAVTGLTSAYPRITCWAQYAPNEVTARWQRHWAGITVKTGYGIGRGERLDGTDGILAAYKAALLNAVRERARKLEKNKPKEVRGEVLLRSEPRLYADEGQFVADIRVLLSLDEIVPWSSF